MQKCSPQQLPKFWMKLCGLRFFISGEAAGLQAVAEASADAFAKASNGKTKAVADASANALAVAISKVPVQIGHSAG